MIRDLIRRTLLEVYGLTQDEINQRREIEEYWGTDEDYARALGLQYPATIKNERSLLQVYQNDLKSTASGQQMIKDFVSGKGNISCAHSITYDGFAVTAGSKDSYDKKESAPFSKWLAKYGSKNKNVISTVAWPKSVGNPPDLRKGDNYSVLKGIGFLMRGYPVFVSSRDVMSQTLGSLPPGLVAHQKESGIAKRTGTLETAIYGDSNWDWSAETLLDNWKPIGVYMSLEHLWDLPVMTAIEIIEDARKTGLPGWIIDEAWGPESWIDDSEWEDDGDGLYEQFFT